MLKIFQFHKNSVISRLNKIKLKKLTRKEYEISFNQTVCSTLIFTFF